MNHADQTNIKQQMFLLATSTASLATGITTALHTACLGDIATIVGLMLASFGQWVSCCYVSGLWECNVQICMVVGLAIIVVMVWGFANLIRENNVWFYVFVFGSSSLLAILLSFFAWKKRNI